MQCIWALMLIWMNHPCHWSNCLLDKRITNYKFCGITIMLFVVINLILICVPKKNICPFFRVWGEVETHKNSWIKMGNIDDVTPVTLEIVRSLAQERRVHPYHLALSSDLYNFLRILSRVLFLPVLNRTTSQTFFIENILYLDRENHIYCFMKSCVIVQIHNQSYFR